MPWNVSNETAFHLRFVPLRRDAATSLSLPFLSLQFIFIVIDIVIVIVVLVVVVVVVVLAIFVAAVYLQACEEKFFKATLPAAVCKLRHAVGAKLFKARELSKLVNSLPLFAVYHLLTSNHKMLPA